MVEGSQKAFSYKLDVSLPLWDVSRAEVHLNSKRPICLTRMRVCINKHYQNIMKKFRYRGESQEHLMDVRVKCVAADSTYANKDNRKCCTKLHGISTSFVRKGRTAKDERLGKVLRSELSKEKAAKLEGSFSTQKQH